MIQFNLLPDVKLEFIKATRMKRIVMLFAIAIAGASLTVFVLLFVAINVLQKQHLQNLSMDIERDSKTLTETPDLDKILTIQNQLNQLTTLHDNKAVTSRFRGYLSQVTPTAVSFAKIELKINDSTIMFSGAADSLKTINQFVDTLKFTTYTATYTEIVDDKPQITTKEGSAFSEVVLTDFGRDEKGASYEINLKFDPEIFSGKGEVKLNVPNTVTTRSVTEKPDENLFQQLSNPEEQEEEAQE